MNRNLLIWICIPVAIILIYILLHQKNTASSSRFLSRLDETYLQLKNDKLLSENFSFPFSSFIDSTCRQLSESLGDRNKSTDAVDSLISLVYKKWEIGFNSDNYDLSGMLPQTVIQTKKGSCIGVTLLFLTMAEKIGCPLYGVILPEHVFIRFDNGSARRNIEPNRNGFSHPDSYYKKIYLTRQSESKRLQNASVKDLLAILNFNIANSCVKQNKPDYAKKYYKKSTKLQPEFAETWGNLALLYDSQGKIADAGKAFAKAYALQPDLRNLSLNMGCFELNHGNPQAALRVIKTGLEYFPENQRLLELYRAAEENGLHE